MNNVTIFKEIHKGAFLKGLALYIYPGMVYHTPLGYKPGGAT